MINFSLLKNSEEKLIAFFLAVRSLGTTPWVQQCDVFKILSVNNKDHGRKSLKRLKSLGLIEEYNENRVVAYRSKVHPCTLEVTQESIIESTPVYHEGSYMYPHEGTPVYQPSVLKTPQQTTA